MNAPFRLPFPAALRALRAARLRPLGSSEGRLFFSRAQLRRQALAERASLCAAYPINLHREALPGRHQATTGVFADVQKDFADFANVER